MTSAEPLSPPPAGVDSSERILTAAERLFAEHGYDAVSISAIAEAADVSKANVFHHFTSKNALYLAVLRHSCRDAARHLDDLDSDAPLPARFSQFVAAHLASVLDNEQVTRLSLRELLSHDPRQGQEMAEQVYGEKFARFVEILRAGQESGELRGDIDPAVVATMLLGANLFFFQAREVLRHFPAFTVSDQPQRYGTMVADILLHGIRPCTATRDDNNR